MSTARKLAVSLSILSILVASSSSAAPSTPGTAPTPSITARPVLKLKVVSKLTAKNVASLPGETKSFEATLTDAKGAPLANESVKFEIRGKSGTSVPGGVLAVGADKTDATGKASVSFKLPELAQGAYAITASFAGSESAVASKDDSNLAMFKTITKIELGDLIWGTYKNEPGPPYGVVGIKLVRTSDGTALSKNLQITVNGHSWTLYGSSSYGYFQVPLPTSDSTWNVSVQFEGDAANAPTAAQRTYKKPS